MCPQCASVLQAALPCPRDGATPISQAHDPMLGATLGSYRIAGKLGSGGMGTVYRAVHPAIGSVVAIKVLSYESANDQDVVNRFFDEARSVNVIRHHNIVNILDLARLPDGRPYIVMELLDGFSLKVVIARGPMQVAEACRIVTAVLDALAAAHARGVLHRDLKPDNIVLSPTGRVTLVDFGVAKIGAMLSSTPRTESGIILGTPHYMSPEQAQGRPVAAATDIYAIGVLLYEMVTGQKPFDGDSLFEILRQQIQEPPRPPSQLVALPPGLENIILIALAKDAGARFGSAGAMQQALWQVVVGHVGGAAVNPDVRISDRDITAHGHGRAAARGGNAAQPSSDSMIANPTNKRPPRRWLAWLVAALAGIGGLVAIPLLRKPGGGQAGSELEVPVASWPGAGSAAPVVVLPKGVNRDAEAYANSLAVLTPAKNMQPLGPPQPGDIRSLEEYVVAAQSGDIKKALAALRVMKSQRDPSSPFVVGTDGKVAIDGFADFAVKRARQIVPDAQLVSLWFTNVSRTGRVTPAPNNQRTIRATFISPALAARPVDVAATAPWSPLGQFSIWLGHEGIDVERSIVLPLETIRPPKCNPSQIWQRAMQRYEPIINDDARITYDSSGPGWSFFLNDPGHMLTFSIDDDCP